jgi:hypothetical protein
MGRFGLLSSQLNTLIYLRPALVELGDI